MKIFAPNYTQTPNELFDEWLPNLNEAELKVLMVIMRKTFGWHKIRDKISLSQLEKHTGLLRQSILKASKSLENKGLISKTVSGIKGREETSYELIVIEDSNSSYQCVSHTPPSVFNTPTKETLTKEIRKEINKEIPISNETGPSIPFSRKKIKETKQEVAPRVLISASEKQDLLRRENGDEKIILNSFQKLSAWKISKGIVGGRSDYKAIVDWALEAAKEDLVKPISGSKKSDQNKEYAKRVCEKFKRLVDDGELILGGDSLIFCGANFSQPMKYSENGFKDQVESRLRKMGLNGEGI